MATVNGYTTDHVDGIEDNLIVSASVDGSGHLILVKHDSSTIDAGVVWAATPDASTTVKGIVELATGTETSTGTDTVRAVTPSGLKVVTDVINTNVSGKQSSSADLTAIAALTPTNDDVLQRKAGAWTNRTITQLASDLSATQLQPKDSDLTAIAGLTPSANDIIQYISGAWANRTMAQLKTALSLAKGDVGLGNVDNTADTAKPVSTAQQTALNLKADLASPTFTGTVTAAAVTTSGKITSSGAIVSPSDALTDAATILVDASVGNYMRVTLGGNRTLGNPSNGTDGQVLTFELIQDGTGSRTLALDTKYAFGTDITSITLSVTANKRDFLTVRYNSTADKWYVLGFLKGY